MIEKERKFKVKSKKFISFSHKVIDIKQGYLSKENDIAIRIRISDKNAYLCIKGPTSKNVAITAVDVNRFQKIPIKTPTTKGGVNVE